MKVDAQIVEGCLRTISCLKEYSYQKLYCKKLRRTHNSTMRRTNLCWMRALIKELLFIKYTLYLCFALLVNFTSWSIRQHSRIIDISEKFVDLNIATKSLYSYKITYYASSLFTRSREKHGWIITASLLLSLAFAERTKSLKFLLKVACEAQTYFWSSFGGREVTTVNTFALRKLRWGVSFFILGIYLRIVIKRSPSIFRPSPAVNYSRHLRNIVILIVT